MGRDKKRLISAMIHQFAKLDGFRKEELVGWLGFANGVEPEFVDRMRSKYGEALIEDILNFRL